MAGEKRMASLRGGPSPARASRNVGRLCAVVGPRSWEWRACRRRWSNGHRSLGSLYGLAGRSCHAAVRPAGPRAAVAPVLTGSLGYLGLDVAPPAALAPVGGWQLGAACEGLAVPDAGGGTEVALLGPLVLLPPLAQPLGRAGRSVAEGGAGARSLAPAPPHCRWWPGQEGAVRAVRPAATQHATWRASQGPVWRSACQQLLGCGASALAPGQGWRNVRRLPTRRSAGGCLRHAHGAQAAGCAAA
mmetsp:Transcript_21290/g.66464  ORF Transcript_21290/g.66464 Transcript_21290/m.66464 type:complete len:245 (-) Transcript_21290:3-737(-)